MPSLTGSLARRTNSTASTRPRPAATAGFTLACFLDLEFFFDSACDFLESKSQSNFQVRARCPPCGAPRPSPPGGEDFVENAPAESTAEDIAECVKDVIDIGEATIVVSS